MLSVPTAKHVFSKILYKYNHINHALFDYIASLKTIILRFFYFAAFANCCVFLRVLKAKLKTASKIHSGKMNVLNSQESPQ